MSTRRVNLDTTQYVRVTTDPLTPSSLILQSHRDTVRIVFSDVKPSRDNEVFHELSDNDEPLYVDMTEQAVWALSMTNTAALTVTQQRVPVEISAEGVMVVSSKDIRVDGSVTPQVFSIKPTVNQSGHFTRLMLSILSTSDMDFSTFGSLPKLTRGCSLRVKRSDTEYVNLFTWKNNEEFILRSFDHAFEDKIGGGEHAFTSKSTFGGQNERGVVLYLDGVDGDELQLVVQDDLSSGLTEFTMVAQGHDIQG